ncbi:MAG: YCF48-related protein [Bacteroidetes bacterium]|nr:YCF48-related protein [Bacteroidota bacterium]
MKTLLSSGGVKGKDLLHYDLLIAGIILLVSLFISGCDVPVKPNENGNNGGGGGGGSSDSGKSSTWMFTDNSGASWYVYTLEYMEYIKAINSFNSNPYVSIIAAGEKGIIIHSVDGGASFTVDSVSAGGYDVNCMYSTGVDLNGIAVGNHGTILRTLDDGNSWRTVTSPTTENLLSVFIEPFSGNGYATGGNGTVLHSIDRGYSWNLFFSNPGSSVTYRNVAFATSVYGNMVGDSGSVNRGFILLSLDGGATWGSASYPPLINIKMYGISFMDSLTGIAVGSGGMILKTTDAGQTWAQKISGVTTDVLSVKCASEVFLACGNKFVLSSYDFGETWGVSNIDSANGKLYSIFRLDNGNYFAGGE